MISHSQTTIIIRFHGPSLRRLQVEPDATPAALVRRVYLGKNTMHLHIWKCVVLTGLITACDGRFLQKEEVI